MCCEAMVGTCAICRRPNQVLQRKYYHYMIHPTCDCCRGQFHFEIVNHCKDCQPVPPESIRPTFTINPIETD